MDAEAARRRKSAAPDAPSEGDDAGGVTLPLAGAQLRLDRAPDAITR